MIAGRRAERRAGNRIRLTGPVVGFGIRPCGPGV